MESEGQLQRMRRQLEEMTLKRNKRLQLKDGMNVIRILPAKNPESDFYKLTLSHYNPTPDVKWILCPQMNGDPCPICNLVNKLSSGDSRDQARAQRMAKKEYYVMNVIPIIRDIPPVVKIFYAPPTVAQDIFSLMLDGDYEDLLDPKEGYNLLVQKTGKEMQTRYKVTPAKRPSAIPMADWAQNMFNLDTEYAAKSTREVVAILKGEQPVNGEGPRESSRRPERPRMSSNRPRPTVTRPRPPADDEDDIPF
jgi:hypothetical protein